MSLYAEWLTRLLWTSALACLSLAPLVLYSRRAQAPAKVRVWLLRLGFVCLLAGIAGGIIVEVPAEASGSATSRSLPVDIGLSTLIGLWFAGVLIKLQGLFQTARSIRELRVRATLPDSATVAATLRLASRYGIPAPQVAMSSDVASVVLVGIGRPTILLPERPWHDNTLEMAVSHELAHLRHRDLAWNWLPLVVQVLFWFHPLVRLAADELCAA